MSNTKSRLLHLTTFFFNCFLVLLICKRTENKFPDPRAPGRFDISGGLPGLTFVFTQSHFSGTWAIKIPTLNWLLEPIIICAGIYELSIRLDVLNEEIISFSSILGHCSELLSPGHNFWLFVWVWPWQGKSEPCCWARTNFSVQRKKRSWEEAPNVDFSAALGPADVEIISCWSINW